MSTKKKDEGGVYCDTEACSIFFLGGCSLRILSGFVNSPQRAVALHADPSEILHTKFKIGQKYGDIAAIRLRRLRGELRPSGWDAYSCFGDPHPGQ